MTYLEWNDRLAAHFFSSGKSGQKVWLFATHDLIEKLGGPFGATFKDFLESTKTGPPWARRAGFCQRALEAMRGWRKKDLVYPPYITFLALFVIAAGLEGDFARHAFYPRLRTLLGEVHETGAFPSFDMMLLLWDDLERWSNVDKRGQWGIFTVRMSGDWIHVGVPVAQTLLSEEERRALPVIFAGACLDAAAPPSEEELARILLAYGKHFFRPKTLSLLKTRADADPEIRQAFAEAVLDELREWDGLVPESAKESGDKLYFSGALRLCCELDRTAGNAKMRLRCKTAGDFPEDGVALSILTPKAGLKPKAAFSEPLRGDEWGLRWSTELEDASGIPVDAAQFDLRADLILEDQDKGWKFLLRQSQVRVLVDGSGDGIGSLVDVRRLPPTSSFYVLTYAEDCGVVEDWGRSSCDGWKEIKVSDGLPTGWRLFFADRALSDKPVRDNYAVLSLPTQITLSFRGGIRVLRGNRYFDFAPPSIEVEGMNISDLVFNDVAGLQNAQGQYDIPKELPLLPDEDPEKVQVEARRDGNIVARVALFLAREGWPWVGVPSWVRFGRFGEETSLAAQSCACGSIVYGIAALAFEFGRAVPVMEPGAIHYIGREPGQIVHWPSQELPMEWSPVWVIVSRKKGSAVFCGTNIATAHPVRGSCKERSKLKKWKEFLWVRRKEIVPPSYPALYALWREYQKMAKDV